MLEDTHELEPAEFLALILHLYVVAALRPLTSALVPAVLPAERRVTKSDVYSSQSYAVAPATLVQFRVAELVVTFVAGRGEGDVGGAGKVVKASPSVQSLAGFCPFAETLTRQPYDVPGASPLTVIGKSFEATLVRTVVPAGSWTSYLSPLEVVQLSFTEVDVTLEV